ncbi:TraR/DksA family transcriptional regulator [Acidithiobacillus sulfuriphilus]|uniref:TraR/DksA family transcriptional regulator n=1 Tax=Acidithiobacillus sulfuriphilus TaxID=1867749 RepID=UPI003F5F3F28
MDAKLVEAFHHTLEDRRRDLLTGVRAHLLNGELAAEERERLEVRDIGDDSVLDLVESLVLARDLREAQALRAVNLALERIQAGTYGVCVDCGEEIPVARLRVESEAERCVACQRHWEALQEQTEASL